MELKTKPVKYSYAYSNASISFEKITASITGITSEATWPTNVKEMLQSQHLLMENGRITVLFNCLLATNR